MSRHGDPALAQLFEVGPVEPRIGVQRVLPGPEVLDPHPAVGCPAELAAGPHDQLAQRVTRLRVIRVGTEQVAQLGVGEPVPPVQGEGENQLALRGLQRGRGAVDRERAHDADPQPGCLAGIVGARQAPGIVRRQARRGLVGRAAGAARSGGGS